MNDETKVELFDELLDGIQSIESTRFNHFFELSIETDYRLSLADMKYIASLPRSKSLEIWADCEIEVIEAS
jgi:hypothetical protein